ncbi:MAG TPA: sulfotransferase domain-containing protein [Terriglobales bacterium]|nr:sulfotransferase domain-containing protein [Terriglobales bacterium]
MVKHFTAMWKRAFRLHHPSESLRILPDDVFLVSYPKSGNTWTRFLIANLLHPDREVGFGNLRELVPDPGSTKQREFDRLPRPRVIKSHRSYRPQYPRVIYIVRDPRDVAISQYHYQRKIGRISDDHTLEQFITDFVAGRSCRHLGSWAENVVSWVSTRNGNPGFLLLRYEDLMADTAHELARVASFLNISADATRLSRAIERSSKDKMRESEKAQGHLCTLTNSRPDLPFVRAAKTGQWKSDLPGPCVQQIQAAWGHVMTWLGYEVVANDDAGLLSRFAPV